MPRKPKISRRGRLDFRLTIADVELADFIRTTAKRERREINQQVVHMLANQMKPAKEMDANG